MKADNIVREIEEVFSSILKEIGKVIIGKEDVIEYLFIALLSEGNILLEGVPGIAKTHIVNLFAKTLGLRFKRIQFTPDILPADVLGNYVYSQKTEEFNFREGPIFANIVLVDEVNRANPRTQSALLEAMEERQVTLENTTFPLERPFMVIATQNPIEFEGTFPLPEAQIDRFLFKIDMTYPTPEEELEIIKSRSREEILDANAVTDQIGIEKVMKEVKDVYIDEQVMEYIKNLVVSTRNDEDLLIGSSPRGSLGLLSSSKVRAAIKGRNYVLIDDVKYLAPVVLSHRLILTPDAEFSDITIGDKIKELLTTIEIYDME